MNDRRGQTAVRRAYSTDSPEAVAVLDDFCALLQRLWALDRSCAWNETRIDSAL